MKTTISAEELRELNICSSTLNVFLKAHGEKRVVLSEFLKSNEWGEICWVIGRSDDFSDTQKRDIQFLIFDAGASWAAGAAGDSWTIWTIGAAWAAWTMWAGETILDGGTIWPSSWTAWAIWATWASGTIGVIWSAWASGTIGTGGAAKKEWYKEKLMELFLKWESAKNENDNKRE